jgi:DNA-directed RNA polymerase specialized sigma24 family protein
MAQKQSKKTAAKKPVAKKPRAKTKSKKKKSEYYVNGKEFKEQIVLFYADEENMTLLNDLSKSIVKIAQGLSYAPNFINYSYRDDMVGDAIVKMFSALRNKKFNTESGHNPFSYFTTIAFHAFINRIKKEKKQRDTISQYQEAVYDSLADINTNNNSGTPDDDQL